MKINKSGAALSRIVQIGETLKELSQKSGKEYLPLNRGVNQVVNIDLTEVVKSINFNSPEIQVYPHGAGRPDLRAAINEEFFAGKSSPDNILITAGGMHALDLVAQTVNIGKLFLPSYYWGCYFKMLKIRSVESEGYDSQADLLPMIDRLRGNAVLISDPSNPLGDKHDDEEQLNIIRALNDAGVVIFYDCPYRRVTWPTRTDVLRWSGVVVVALLFFGIFVALLDNVIITESFSKSVGLSGQRLGFIHTCNKELHDELEVRVMYNTNGINGFAQELVLRLLTTPEGKKAVTAFKERTTRDIALNIEYLRARGLLAEEFYHGTTPRGIFVIVNRGEEELLEHYIGAVSLSFFTKTRQEYAKNYSRICVSVPHDKLVKYFETI